jgi:hypothetical protein
MGWMYWYSDSNTWQRKRRSSCVVLIEIWINPQVRTDKTRALGFHP